MRCAFVLAVLLLAANAEAAETWTYASSDHFEVYTTGSAGTARDALNYFERIHAFFTDEFRVALKAPTRTRLIIFSNSKQFAPYRPNEVATAFYLSGADRDYIVMEHFDEQSNPVVVHEYTHLVIRHSGIRLPVWLNEGVAEFFSTVTPEGGRMTYGKVPVSRLLYLRGSGILDLPRLFAVGHESAEYNTPTHAGVFYSESWALTHMLRNDERYRLAWRTFFEGMAKGMTAADALMQAYKKTPEAVGRDLVNYISQDRYLYRRTDYKLPPDTKYETRAADAFEAGLVTANLLASSPKGQEAARAAFTRLEEEKPNDVALLESRAYFEMRHGKRAAALSYFARAVEQGSRNTKMMVDYARADPSRAAALIPQALAIAPDDVDVRIEHARILLREGKGADAIRAFEGITGMDRQQSFEFGQILTNAYLLLDRPSEAREALKLVTAYAEEGPQAMFAAVLARQVEDYASQRAALEQRAQAAGTAQGSGAVGDGSRPPAVTNSPPSASLTIVTVTGRIRNIVCQNGETILEVLAIGRTLRLFIDNGNAIAVLGKPGNTVDLKCGPQDVPIKVGYTPRTDDVRKVVGYVRLLDYR